MHLPAVIAIVTILSAPQGTGGSMPKLLRDDTSATERILFVSASEAFTPDGRLRTEHFSREASLFMEGMLEMPSADGCIHYEERFDNSVNLPFRDSVESAIATSEYVFEGRVVEREYGFRNGEPGQLLRLADVTAPGRPLRRDRLFVFFPVGRFTAGPLTICKTDRRYAAEPHVGDRIVVFAIPHSLIGDFVDMSDEAGLIVVRKNGNLSLPARLDTEEAPRDLEALHRRIAAALVEVNDKE